VRFAPDGIQTMPQFVLLEHDHPMLHWDFMLESGDVLLTWRLDRIPGSATENASDAVEIAAQALPVHRKDYLDYEGPVSGDRGSVIRIDHGSYELLASSASELIVRLSGDHVCGEARLLQVSPQGSPDESAWRMIWQSD
jgi:hypothetical protein